MPNRDSIEVQRRRKGEDPEGKPRAQAPTRSRKSDKTPSGSQTPPSLSPSGQHPSSGRGIKLPIWLVIPLVIIFLIFNLFSGGEDNSVPISEPVYQEEVMEIQPPISTPEDITISPVEGDGHTWLVMLYQDADDKILEKDIYIDLNEAEKVGSTDRVHIVAQIDRYQAGYSGDGNWVSTRRYYLTRDQDLNKIGSQLVQELGETNMADGSSLVDFVIWAVKNYPADKYVLILSDHGMGWPGGWSDPSPGGRDANPAPLAAKLGEHLFLSEIDQALEEIRMQTGINKFEIIGFDACLMAQLEVFSMLDTHARYAIASEETEPALGWAYTSFLNTLISNPDMGGAELSKSVIDSYISEDQRIIDPVAREDFTSQGSPLAVLFGVGRATSEQLEQQLGNGVTLSAVDLSMLPELMQKFNEFVYSLQDEDQAIVASARTYARSYTSIFGREVPPSYIDLGHFIQLISRETRNQDVKRAADNVIASLGRTIIAEKHGQGKKGSTGISIYFPNSTLYKSPMAGPQSYTTIAEKFSSASLWDDFLAFHYHNRPFDLITTSPPIPFDDTETRVPGLGMISVSPIKVSSEIARPGEPVDFSVDIRGENIGYIKLFVGFYDQASNSIFYADTDFLESPDTLELNGVYYPKWSDSGDFTMEFTWDPYLFAITDGINLIPALFKPESYGETSAEAIYTVDGIFEFADGSEGLPARMYFQDGSLVQVFGFTGVEETGAPREIIPKIGDQFRILNQWMDMDENGNVTGNTFIEGETLTFHEDSFRWEEVYAAPGIYVVGFIIEDLDGNTYPVFTQIIVE